MSCGLVAKEPRAPGHTDVVPILRGDEINEVTAVIAVSARACAGSVGPVCCRAYLMKIHVMTAGMVQTNAYLLTQEAGGGEAVLIDAPQGVWAEVAGILEKEKCVLKELWLTHGHFDHIQGVEEIVKATGVKVFAHEEDREMMASPEVVEARLGFPLGLKAVYPDGWFTVGEKRAVAGAEAEVRHVPGHCPGNVLFYFAKEGVAFVGDAIFAGSVGRTDFEGGSFPVLGKSIREQIYTLPEATVLLSGHGPKTTVAAEKRGNPYVKG